jgi:hypothetical protein
MRQYLRAELSGALPKRTPPFLLSFPPFNASLKSQASLRELRLVFKKWRQKESSDLGWGWFGADERTNA